MSVDHVKSTEHWIEHIAKKELPALTSTAHLLDKFANDDISSLPKLSEKILYDQGLSSCVLKVANSIPHLSVAKVTTVSRATVVLGIQAVKNICLTSKLLDGLLRSKNLSQPVYLHVIQLMASSFYAGILAKMMVADYNEDTQEEVYLASMLYRIGETAFWSSGGEITEILIEKMQGPEQEFERQVKLLTGTTFKQLSIGLAKTWKLSDLLVKSLDDPQSRTVEMQIIYLADKLSRYIANPPSSIHDFNQVLDDISKIMQISQRQLRERIKIAKDHAVELLVSYGAGVLVKHIKPLPTINDFTEKAYQPLASELSREQQQLQALKQLTDLSKSSKNLNFFLQHTVENVTNTIGFDRCSFLMLSPNKEEATVRFSHDRQDQTGSFSAKINLKLSDNLISYVLKNQQAELINDYQNAKWRDYITRDMVQIVGEGSFCLAPVLIDNRPLGVILAQDKDKEVRISRSDFDVFTLFVDHLNMCLSRITKS